MIGALLPEGAIVSDEANTSGLWLPGATAGAPPHDWLTLTGGAIGQGLPLATGAAIACPGRSVLALEADGSAMYTISALWTQAREALDVTTVIFSNRAYAILDMELDRVGATAGGQAGPQPAGPVPARPRFHRSGAGHGRPGQPGGHGAGVRRAAEPGAGRAGAAPDRGDGPPDRVARARQHQLHDPPVGWSHRRAAGAHSSARARRIVPTAATKPVSWLGVRARLSAMYPRGAM